jgi:hypothetical protein
VLVSCSSYAQQFGLSAQGLLSFQKQRTFQYGNSDREVRTGPGTATGIRLEMNYILPGYSIPVSAYNGIGITYLAPWTDSAVTTLRFKNTWQGAQEVALTQKISMLSIGFRCGYEFPQQFSDFLLLHYGWGFSWTRFKGNYVIPEQSPTFNYTEADFEEESFEPVVARGISIEIILGGVYEFEKFSLLGQYSGLIPLGNSQNTEFLRIRHGLTVGIFYTLADLR